MAGSSAVPPYIEAVSGSIGASVANVLVYPLDLVASRLQTKTPQDKNVVRSRRAKKDVYANLFVAIETIYKSTGINGFYQGIAADTLATAVANFLYFYVYSALHKLRARSKIAASSNASRKITFSGPEELVIGCLAGILSRAVTTPLSAIAVRKQTASKPEGSDEAAKDSKALVVEDQTQSTSSYQPETSMDIARDIYKTYGVFGFWRGYSSACALTVNPAITFYLIAALKTALLPRARRDNPTPRQTFFISASAAAISSTICFPLILAKTRLQWKSPTGRTLYNNLWDVFVKTVEKSGFTGLYAGLQAQIIKGFIAHGVTMMAKQRVELLVQRAYQAARSRRSS